MAGTTMTISNGEGVLVPVYEYEQLVRDSERLSVVKNLVANSSYVGKGDLLLVLGVEEEPKEQEKAGEE
jgi:hypothetical protein